MNRVIRDILQTRSIPQYACVGLRDPQDQIRVSFEDGRVGHDVTSSHVIVSMRPLLVGIGWPADAGGARVRHSLLALRRLVFHDRSASDRAITTLTLWPWSTIPLSADRGLAIYRPIAHSSRCLSRPAAHAYALRELRKLRRLPPYTFRMTFLDLMRMFAFYTCPRPVAFISVQLGERGNLFPMDLIGSLDDRHFSLALRSTSPSVELITKSRRVAVCGVPIHLADQALALGKHHRLANIAFDHLPFEISTSKVLGLPVPVPSLGVIELEIQQVHSMGSHTLFLGVRLSSETRHQGDRMFHISGQYQSYLKRHGRAAT